jgi:hypothetical protein
MVNDKTGHCRCLADVQLKAMGLPQPVAVLPVQSGTTRQRKASVSGSSGAPASGGGWFSGWWGTSAASAPAEPAEPEEEVFEDAVCQ